MHPSAPDTPAAAEQPARRVRSRRHLRRFRLVLPWSLLLLATSNDIIEALAGDPATVSIVRLGREVHPKATIAQACRHSVIRVRHLEEAGVGPDSRYQRWSVEPVGGHVDRVLLDTVTGKTICP